MVRVFCRPGMRREHAWEGSYAIGLAMQVRCQVCWYGPLGMSCPHVRVNQCPLGAVGVSVVWEAARLLDSCASLWASAWGGLEKGRAW